MTGNNASSLRELREQLRLVPMVSVYHHFWGRLLLPHFVEPEYNNDFASWAFRSLQDKTLAERLSALNPDEFDQPETLRLELIELIDERLEENEVLGWRPAEHAFRFQYAQMVVFDTNLSVTTPRELAEVLAHVPEGTIFYHFIDARRRNPEKYDDFSIWLRSRGSQWSELAETISNIDPYFSTLNGIRRRLLGVLPS